MIWAWLSFGLAAAASIYGRLTWLGASPVWAAYLYLSVPILFTAIPLVWRRATLASAALLAIFTFNPLIFANQLVYVPATAAMLFSYVAFRHERQAAQEAVGRYP